MGTRAVIHVKQNEVTLVTIYCHCDGYPKGLGSDIYFALGKGDLSIANGIINYDVHESFNGMGDLAAHLIKELKIGPGGIYINKPDSCRVWENYIYTIYNIDDDIALKCESASEYGLTTEFDGILKNIKDCIS